MALEDLTTANPRIETAQPQEGFVGWPYPVIDIPSKTATMYEVTRAASVVNHQGPRITIPTNLVIEKWHQYSTGHTDDQWILDGVQYGFPLQYKGPPRCQTLPLYNHPSATKYPQVIREYLKKESEMGALYGPFDRPPFTPWMWTSPMMTREKPDSADRRVIVDLSYPEGGVNEWVEPHLFNGNTAHHNLPTVDQAAHDIAVACPGDVHIAVIDLSRAYRQFPVPPTDWPLLGIWFDGQYFWDGRLPFGARMSSFVMQSVASFITRALKKQGIHIHMYLDDIIMISQSEALAKRHYSQILELLKELGLQVAHKKLQPPARAATWLGIKFDLDTNHLSIPASKLQLISRCLAAAARQTRITKRHLQSVLGFINHLSKVVRAARVFIARLLAALRAAEGDVVDVTAHVKADLAWFSRFLATENARSIIPHERTVLRIWADSCLQGGGATDGHRYYAYRYPPAIANGHHISQLEALNVLAAVRAFTTMDHAGGIVEVYCDNQASVSAYSSGRARDYVLAACCRAMWFKAAATQTTLRFTHVPGEAMVLPDALSRAHLSVDMKRQADAIIDKMGLTHINPSAALYAYKSFL